MDTIQLYVNHGRWIADCPACNSALAVKYLGGPILFGMFACFDCGQGLSPEFLATMRSAEREMRWQLFANEKDFFRVSVVFPDNWQDIETELMMRESDTNKNWQPGETVENLQDENRQHGVG